MATMEHTINVAIADLLTSTRHAWLTPGVVSSENTGMLKGSNARPDILVLEQYVSPVAIETEVLPALTAESDALARLGEKVRTTGKPILSCVAMRLPAILRKKDGAQLKSELISNIDLEMALYTGTRPDNYTRWPQSGWVKGGIADLSILVQAASIPPSVIEAAADELVSGVSEAAGLLEEIAKAHPGAIHKISEELRQEDSAQTRRMAATMLANAFVFHETLAGGPGDLAAVNNIEQLSGSSAGLNKSSVLAEWRKILKVNYWPIFDIARRILEVIPASDTQPLIEGLTTTASRLLQSRLMRSHDLTGAVFQKLIADRKFLAAYYTTPASAALLMGLAITPEGPPGGRSWASAEDMKKLRMADFACGTGTLISTAYQRVSQLHELAGGNAEAIHAEMMAHALVGCDVLPAAAHLTASMLAGAHPTVKYDQSSILTVAYGRQPDGNVALGSLDLLDIQRKFDVLSITAKAAEGLGEAEKATWETLPHESFDLVIMNPPFTRPTGQEGRKIGVPNPMFAAFSSSDEEQRAMGKATERLTRGTSAHGNAGEASIFLVLADRKLKEGGVLALVMPLSLVLGDSWEASRLLLAKNYNDLIIVSISGANGADISFSADTEMGECLVIGRKSNKGSGRATFVVLNERPAYPLLGASAAEQIHRLIASGSLRSIEDGPMGGTPLTFGTDIIGHVLDAPLPSAGSWHVVRVDDLSLAQVAYQLVDAGRVWLPSMQESRAIAVPMTTVSEIGRIGPYHADISSNTATGGVRGPFNIQELKPNSAPTYPVLWSHVAERERTMMFEPDSEGIPKRGKNAKEHALIDVKIASIWASASHCHFNRDFRFNSQSTGMQYTERKAIGGRAWPSIKLASSDLEKALVAWGNTTLGLLARWWHSNRQQAGRGSVPLTVTLSLPVLDVTSLSPEQLARAVRVFDDMKEQALLPVHQIDRDDVRRELDERFARDVLALPDSLLESGGPVDLLRRKLSREPSIRGTKED